MYALQKAEAQLAYELQAAKEQQKIRLEEIEIEVVQRKKQITIEEKEIERTDKELIAIVKRPAEAEAYKMQQLAEGHKWVVSVRELLRLCRQGCTHTSSAFSSPSATQDQESADGSGRGWEDPLHRRGRGRLHRGGGEGRSWEDEAKGRGLPAVRRCCQDRPGPGGSAQGLLALLAHSGLGRRGWPQCLAA